MKYDRTKPCAHCPFTSGACRLTPARVREITNAALGAKGAEFVCHETLGLPKDNQQHCAGALIFALKKGTLHQMGRICERIGNFDSQKIMADPYVVYRVFASVREMTNRHQRGY